mmetsp:Transcript_22324/g.41630  ORF Transcript_22324/g.41630 Transcript_22324/m.41630 type:complete len:251 (+) Transcript_22324:186-938(+)
MHRAIGGKVLRSADDGAPVRRMVQRYAGVLRKSRQNHRARADERRRRQWGRGGGRGRGRSLLCRPGRRRQGQNAQRGALDGEDPTRLGLPVQELLHVRPVARDGTAPVLPLPPLRGVLPPVPREPVLSPRVPRVDVGAGVAPKDGARPDRRGPARSRGGRGAERRAPRDETEGRAQGSGGDEGGAQGQVGSHENTSADLGGEWRARSAGAAEPAGGEHRGAPPLVGEGLPRRLGLGEAPPDSRAAVARLG